MLYFDIIFVVGQPRHYLCNIFVLRSEWLVVIAEIWIGLCHSCKWLKIRLFLGDCFWFFSTECRIILGRSANCDLEAWLLLLVLFSVDPLFNFDIWWRLFLNSIIILQYLIAILVNLPFILHLSLHNFITVRRTVYFGTTYTPTIGNFLHLYSSVYHSLVFVASFNWWSFWTPNVSKD